MPLSKDKMREYQAMRRAKDKVNADKYGGWGEPTVLSDGQLWWPGHMGLHPPGCECGAKHIEKPAC